MAAGDEEIRPGFVAIGRVLGAFGVRGDLKVEALGPDSCLAAGRTVSISDRKYVIQRSRRRERFLYVKLAGVGGREAAAGLRGAYLQTPEGDLPPLAEGEFYRFQLIGLAVRTTDGGDLGEIKEVLSTPENDVFVVRGPAGEVLIPATADVIQQVDLERRLVTIEAIPGLLAET